MAASGPHHGGGPHPAIDASQAESLVSTLDEMIIIGNYICYKELIICVCAR